MNKESGCELNDLSLPGRGSLSSDSHKEIRNDGVSE